MTRKTCTLWAALVGVLSAGAALAVAEAASLLVSPAASPLFAVGSFVIDIVPPWVKDLTIRLFGTADKLVLLASLGILVALLAGASGILEYRKAHVGKIVLALTCGVAVVAVLTRAGASALWAVPTTAGMIAGVLVLHRLTRRLRTWAEAPVVGSVEGVAEAPSRTARLDRRGFLSVAIAVAAASAIVGVASRVANAGITAANAVRQALRLPSPAQRAAAIPAGAELDVAGITRLVSTNDDFYRIDTALQVPTVDATSWRLRITGMVENEIEISFEELLALPLIETYVTLMCVSNEVGGRLVGNAKWLGYPIRELLQRAVPKPGADMVLSRSVDGWTASTPLSVLLEPDRNSLLAVGMNDEPLPLEHGFPVRMVVPGLYGYVSATKWVVELQVTRFDDQRAYWTDRGWSAEGPVKTSSRIDVPRAGARVGSGPVAIAGVAWAQHTGVEGVEVRVDGGEWQRAELATSISEDTWVQWKFEWDAPEGSHDIQARAIDSSGFTQSGDDVGVIPNGAEGWHTVTVTVENT